MKGVWTMDRLKKDLGIRAILALILVCSLVAMIFTGRNVPEGFMSIVTAAVVFYFANRSTIDKSP